MKRYIVLLTPEYFNSYVIVFVDIDALNTKRKLSYWVNLTLDYNKIAKPSKKKRNEI